MSFHLPNKRKHDLTTVFIFNNFVNFEWPDWLTEWATEWLSDWVIDWLIDWHLTEKNNGETAENGNYVLMTLKNFIVNCCIIQGCEEITFSLE